MRILPLVLLGLASGLALLRAEPLGNFKSSGFSYGYEKWSDLGATQQVGKEGVTLLGPAAGGAGIFLQQGLDLQFIDALELSIKLTPDNTASAVILKIPDVQEWRIDLSKVPADTFTKMRFPLSEAARAKGGEVKNVQLQGTFTPGQTVGVTIKDFEVVAAK